MSFSSPIRVVVLVAIGITVAVVVAARGTGYIPAVHEIGVGSTGCVSSRSGYKKPDGK